MGIVLASNFDVNAALPLDSRMVVADLTARNAIVSGVRYEGMIVYVTSEETNFQLVGGVTNSDWTELSGGGGGPVTVQDISATGSINAASKVVAVNAASASVTATLPPATTVGEEHWIKRKDSVEANTVTVAADGSDTIDGDANRTLPIQYSTLKVVCIATGLWGVF